MVKQELDHIFNPKSVAIVGVSSQGLGLQMGGAAYVESLLACGFKGGIYPVNPKGGEVFGLQIYPSIKDIPESVDYVVCCITAEQIPVLIQDCAAKGVKVIQIYAGGFSETGTEEGKQLEKDIYALARQYGIRLMGPNCLGVYHPEAKLTYFSDLPGESGPVSFICQSGGNSGYVVREAARRGIKFSKVISYGNACDINETELLEFLSADSNTKIITAYMEGVKDGRKFKKVLEEAAKAKPVIILKGGASEAGSRAATSHTGALAGTDRVWDALLYQTGAVRVSSLEELVDMTVTFSFMPVLPGRKAAIFGWGGGATVLAADDCAGEGLVIPRLPQQIQDELEGYMQKGKIGVGLSNPVDISDQVFGTSVYDCAKAVFGYEGIDFIIYHMSADIGHYPTLGKVDAGISVIVEDIIKAQRESGKPMAVAIPFPISVHTQEFVPSIKKIYSDAGLPVYHSLGNAAKAISRFIDYHERKKRMLE